MRVHVITLLWGLALSFLGVTLSLSQSLPYNPTTIFLPQISSKNKDIAYAFLQNSKSSTQHQLVSLNISSTISAGNLGIWSITPNLPFISDNTTAFTPAISSDGQISVYTGSCKTSTSSALWRFTPSNTSTTGNGTWAQESTNTASDVTSAVLPGADFLSSGFSFSTFVKANASQSKMYIFGGMCPSPGANDSTWQSAANYSNHMLRLAPSTSSSSNTAYTLDLTSSRGPPVAEAGFTITGLTPTTSNSSGIETQQQTFVIIGGHTQGAFINTSQIAIWSLPEESWSFLAVDSPITSSGSNTELAIKSTVTTVDSRSGHTAVLTEDGSKIIVYGGWVGDVGQAADPQLAVLSLGTGYGGTGDWRWSVPDHQPPGSGIYGHGAVMLPGNVMMVLGGHNISSSSTSKRAVPSTQATFFNATSMAWTSNYTNPAYIATIAQQNAANSASSSKSSTSKKVGLGAGLGLGLAAIIIAILVFIWYTRRLKKRRTEEREKNLESIQVGDGGFYHTPNGGMVQRHGGFPWTHGRWNGNDVFCDPEGQMYDSTSAVAGYENLHSGVHALGEGGEIPLPPKQISRKPIHSRSARGQYQPTPTFDFNAGSGHVRANSLGTAGPIHPIYEADEDDHGGIGGVEGVGVALGDPNVAPATEANHHSDPFRDPPIITTTLVRRDSRSVSTPTPDLESPAQSREREIQEWVSDWAAADALLSAQARSHSHAGRLSPTRRAQLIAGSTVSSMSGEEDSGRTASNLSERSIAISAISISRSGSSSQGRSRSNSLRGFIGNALSPFTSTMVSGTVVSSTMSPVFDSPHGQRSYVPPRSAGSGSGASSFATAHTSFPALQAEGENLLPRPGDFLGGENSPTRSHHEPPGSPSKQRRQGRGQVSWLGNLRRVFVGDPASGNTSPSRSPTDPSFSSREPSPIRIGQSSPIQPRRTVSAGATLWRRKQGRGDWEDSAEDLRMGGSKSERSNTFTGEYSGRPGSGALTGDEEEEEWDIERAVENRVVQVMFTVPKEKLRVVNHDFGDEREGSDVGSLRSRKGSAKSLRAVDNPLPPPVLEDKTKEEQDVLSEKPILEAGSSTPSRGTSGSVEGSPKGKSKVLEIVEKIERIGSPERER